MCILHNTELACHRAQGRASHHHRLTPPRSLTHPLDTWLDKLSKSGACGPQRISRRATVSPSVGAAQLLSAGTVTCAVFIAASCAWQTGHMLCVMMMHEHLHRRTAARSTPGLHPVSTDGRPIAAPPHDATDTSGRPSVETFTIGAAAQPAHACDRAEAPRRSFGQPPRSPVVADAVSAQAAGYELRGMQITPCSAETSWSHQAAAPPGSCTQTPPVRSPGHGGSGRCAPLHHGVEPAVVRSRTASSQCGERKGDVRGRCLDHL